MDIVLFLYILNLLNIDYLIVNQNTSDPAEIEFNSLVFSIYSHIK